jgi:rhamnosyltransferase
MSVSAPPLRPLRTVAGIVAFHPDSSGLLRLIAAVAGEVSRVIVFANSVLDPEMKSGMSGAAGQTPITLISPGENVGLGKAYNRIVELARLEGAEFVLLFDQDSMPSEGMVRGLEDLADELVRQGEKPFKIPRRRSGRLRPPGLAVDFAISSGSLIALTATAEVGPFDESFFIDAIDIEWCSRAWDAGWSVWLGMDILMTHRLGMGVIHLPFGLRLTDQPPERLYTYFRNQVAMLRLPHVPSAWKLRFVASLPARSFIYAVRNRFSPPVVKAIGLGLADGIMNRLGSPSRGWRAVARRAGLPQDGGREPVPGVQSRPKSRPTAGRSI